MHKPLELPLRTRLWRFLHGLVFYNTVYWKRASDDLNPPKLSRAERESLQPTPEPSFIRPREKPRASLDGERGGSAQISDRDVAAMPAVPLDPAVVEAAAKLGLTVPQPSDPPAVESPRHRPPPGPDASALALPPERTIKRRRYRRTRVSTTSSRAEQPGKDAPGLFGRIFKRRKHR